MQKASEAYQQRWCR